MFERDQIEAILNRYEDAIRRRDADAVVADYAPDAVGFDLAPPLVQDGEALRDAGAIRQWFDTWEDDLRVTHAKPEILQDGDLAVLYGLQRMTGTKKGEGPVDMWFRATCALRRIAGEWKVDMWFRATCALRRIAGEWKIVHIHTSVPFAWTAAARRCST